jgi:pimeloyl-ACP methyl ester carboxylesterase
MIYALIIVAAIVLAGLLAWFVFPHVFVAAVQGLMRRASGLTLKSVTVDGIAWPYLEGGPAEGETVIFVHGFGGEKDQWTRMAGHFTKAYHVIIPDLPGFGESGAKGREMSYHTAKQAERLRAFLRALGVEKFHIAGNSMGGMIALRYAEAFPDDLISMTLLNNAGIATDAKTELQIGLEDGKNLLSVSVPEDIDRLLTFLAHEPLAVPAPFKKVMFEKAKAHEDLHNQIFFEELSVEALEDPYNDKLHQIHTPTLIIWGTSDRLLHVTCADVLREGLPRAHCVIFEETGHVPMMERPKETADEQLGFIEKVRSGAFA